MMWSGWNVRVMNRVVPTHHHPLSTLDQYVGVAASAGAKEQVTDVARLEDEAQLGGQYLATRYVAALALKDRA